MGPLTRPVVLGPVEARGAQPVLQREFLAVADPEPALLGTVDEEQAPERPEGLATDVGRVLLVDDDHAVPAFDELACGDQSGQTCSHDDDVGVCHETSP